MDQLISVKDLERRLSVSRSTVYRLLKSHHIRPVYVAGCIRVKESDVAQALGLDEVHHGQ